MEVHRIVCRPIFTFMASGMAQRMKEIWFGHKYTILSLLVLIVYAFNLGIDIMEIDAAQYAAISREMAETGNYLQVYFRGQDYLDKPPLLFWLASLGIQVLGPTTIAYKIVPMGILILGLWGTFRFASLWYDRRTGILAMLIAGTTQAFYLMSNDVRTDGLLTSFVMMALWQGSCFLKREKWMYLLTTGACIGAAMLAKGPIGLFIPLVALGAHLMLKGHWKRIFDVRWFILLPVIALMLAPMCYGLYTQFDLHPEKEVYGLKGPSGLGFYFWTQSFGRITGDNPFDNNTPWYFLLQTMLWDFQPWVLLLIPAFWSRIKSLWQRTVPDYNAHEYITLSGFVIPFMAVSFSSYKLPHYIFPLLPFAAVIVADYMMRMADRLPRWLEGVQLSVIHVLLVATILVLFWVFPVTAPWLPILWLLLLVALWWCRKNAVDATDRWIIPSVIGTVAFQLILSVHFYPQLLRYQSSAQVGRYIAAHHPDRVYWHDQYGYTLDYYSDRAIPNAYGPPVDTLPPGTWIWVSEKALPTMPPNNILQTYDDFRVTRLSKSFLDPKTRPGKLGKMYLIEVRSKG